MSDTILSTLVVLIIIIVLFVVLRELVTWYWKLNKIVELLEQIEENTRPKGKKSVEPLDEEVI